MSYKEYDIAAIVVTYNRKILLEETIEALLNQTVKLDEIIIVNNCSTDGTESVLEKYKESISIINLERNIGGAGGFNNGLKYAYEKGHSLFWIMDDDTIAEQDALEKLIYPYNKLKDDNIGFLCSNVSWIDGTPCLMNIPVLDGIFNEKLSDNLIKVKSATFVSMLITREAINNCGYPIKEFFIWADDTEFTQRIGKKFNNYMVIDSTVIHKMNVNLGADIVSDKNRLERYFYAFRNRFYIGRRNGVKSLVKYLIRTLLTIIKIIAKSQKFKFKKVFILLKGTLAGLFFFPKVEYPNDK